MPDIFREALFAILYLVGFWVIIAVALELIDLVVPVPPVARKAAYLIGALATVFYIFYIVLNHVH